MNMNQAMSVEKHPHTQVLVRFQDCDPLGHLNNGKYIDYFMNAREDHLREYYDLDIYEITKSMGMGWVVTQNQIAYLKPAVLNEKVIIESMLIHFEKHSVIVELKMWNEKKTHLKSVLWSKFVSIDVRNGKKISIPREFYVLEEILVDVSVEKGFDHRVAQLMRDAKSTV